jgi:hypothetical protein
VLFGGRELPERPLWVRLLTVALVLYVAWPVVKPGVASLQDMFLKMSAEEAASQLGRRRSLFGPMPAPDPDVRCEPGSDGWDYVCSYNYQSKLHRVKVGVLAGHESLTRISAPHEMTAKRITATGAFVSGR